MYIQPKQGTETIYLGDGRVGKLYPVIARVKTPKTSYRCLVTRCEISDLSGKVEIRNIIIGEIVENTMEGIVVRPLPTDVAKSLRREMGYEFLYNFELYTQVAKSLRREMGYEFLYNFELYTQVANRLKEGGHELYLGEQNGNQGLRSFIVDERFNYTQEMNRLPPEIYTVKVGSQMEICAFVYYANGGRVLMVVGEYVGEIRTPQGYREILVKPISGLPEPDLNNIRSQLLEKCSHTPLSGVVFM